MEEWGGGCVEEDDDEDEDEYDNEDDEEDDDVDDDVDDDDDKDCDDIVFEPRPEGSEERDGDETTYGRLGISSNLRNGLLEAVVVWWRWRCWFLG
ncbi:hypothetical protein BGZ94_006150 [Podila epigama]|nr:hypothetical protein BGZ94_006150 [Podila epigama]